MNRVVLNVNESGGINQSTICASTPR